MVQYYTAIRLLELALDERKTVVIHFQAVVKHHGFSEDTVFKLIVSIYLIQSPSYPFIEQTNKGVTVDDTMSISLPF